MKEEDELNELKRQIEGHFKVMKVLNVMLIISICLWVSLSVIEIIIK